MAFDISFYLGIALNFPQISADLGGMTFLCSSDRAETAESYCLGRLSGLEAEMFEEHFVACQECAAEVERAEIFIRAIRAAGMELYGRPTNLIQ